jgi:2-methylcitrate dehydratase
MDLDTIKDTLASYAYELSFSDLEISTVHQVKRTIIDSIGCLIGGFYSDTATIARKIAPSVINSPATRILGTNNNSSLDMAAFANAVALRYLDFNDSFFSPGGGHPSDMIPASLAAGDYQNSSGREIILSIALAYQVFCSVSDIAPIFGSKQWDQGLCVGMGASLASGKLLGLSKEELGHSLSISIVPNLPLMATRSGELSMWKGCATAYATKAGVFAAMLAKEGMEGPYEPFEGRNGLWEKANIDFIDPKVLEKQFIPFGITRTDFKFFPSQILTQAPTGLALELGEKLNVNDIKSIRIETYASCVSTPESHPEKWNPKTRESADHSIPFMVASALLYGEIGVNSFTRERIASEQIRSIISKLTIIENPSYTEKHPGQSNCKMQIELNDGQTSTSETSYPKGHSKNPLSDTELTDKFLNLTATVIKQEQAQKILSLIWEMETTKNLTELFDTLVI